MANGNDKGKPAAPLKAAVKNAAGPAARAAAKSAAKTAAKQAARSAAKSAMKNPARRGLLSPFQEMDLLFDRLSHGLMSRMGFPALDAAGWPAAARAPKIDLVDRGKELLVRAEVPGVAKDDLKVSIVDNVLTLRGETRKETTEEKGEYHHREITRGSFQRTLALPAGVDASAAKATFNDGVLELVLPKRETVGARRIDIT